MCDVEILETDTEYRKTFLMFCFKDTDNVMKIMASWLTIYKLEGAI